MHARNTVSELHFWSKISPIKSDYFGGIGFGSAYMMCGRSVKVCDVYGWGFWGRGTAEAYR